MIAVVIVCLARTANAVSREFENACHKGADARVGFHVVDDMGNPVPFAKVKVFFDMMDRSKGRRVIGETDTNGVFIAEAKTGGNLEIAVSCEGYYSSNDKICFIAMGREHEVKSGRWQPWGMIQRITLLPVKKPQAKVAAVPKWRMAAELNKWIGFDLMKYDFVKPYGSGNDSDMEIMFDWDGAWRQKEYNGMALKIRFRDNLSGGYYADKTPGSEYEGIYQANANGDYKREFIFSERVGGRNKEGYATSYERNLFDSSKVLVVRSRCTLHEDGTLKSAHYFQLGNIMFSGDNDGRGALRFLSIYNPTPNDTNLEPKR